MLHTEPSFSVYADEDEVLDDKKGNLKVKIGSGEFSFAENMGLRVENYKDDPLSGDVEENYKRMLDEDPLNPVFLKKYAHLLQSNGDVNGAEEYYFRATMADPEDGENLMQYAKLVWELHRDQDKASGYFESAVHAAPQDSDVLAAYARFLWEIDENEENNEATTVLVNADGLGSNDVEEFYKKTVNKNCRDPLLLTNYARFLQQTKGDLEGAEKYYSRAIQANPRDGEVISQYAQLVWELHGDQKRASNYFQQSINTAPSNSHVLAAYAKFLWEADDDED